MEYKDSRHCHTHKHLYYNNIFFSWHFVCFVFPYFSVFINYYRTADIHKTKENQKNGQEKKEHPHKTNTYKLFKA